jgi:hypothetical protein
MLPIQPEPWRVPPHGIGRKNGGLFVTSGSDEQLVTYQHAVRDLLWDKYGPTEDLLADTSPVKLTFYYVRQLGKGIHAADATNLNKALEDALQGVLYENDRIVLDVRGVIIAQHVEATAPYVVIHIEDAHDDPDGFGLGDFPAEVLADIVRGNDLEEPDADDNVWPPRR